MKQTNTIEELKQVILKMTPEQLKKVGAVIEEMERGKK